MRSFVVFLAGICPGFLALSLHADIFGVGGNQFVVDFVHVGNAGNALDAGAGGGIYSSPYGGVGYDYRISIYEISEDIITKARNLGMANVLAGRWAESQPAADMSWYEAAAFVNWLNINQGYHVAYDLSFSGHEVFGWSMNLWGPSDRAGTGVPSGTNPYRHKDAFYFLPSEDEWYKAAYHHNDGVTANYWDYPTGGNAVPDGIDFAGDPDYEAVFNEGGNEGPHSIDDAGSSPSSYGTFGQGGNLDEWLESAFDGVNDSASEHRATRGCPWHDTEHFLRSSQRGGSLEPDFYDMSLGFRVASGLPEPTALSLLGLGSLTLVMARQWRRRSNKPIAAR